MSRPDDFSHERNAMLTVPTIDRSTTVLELTRVLCSLGASLSVSHSVFPGRDQPAFIAVVDGRDPCDNAIRAVETRADMTDAIAAAVADYGVRLGRAMASPMLASDDRAPSLRAI